MSEINDTIKIKAEAFFKQNQLISTLFATSDTFLFTREQDAKKHGESLENSAVVPIAKSDVVSSEKKEGVETPKKESSQKK